MSSPTLTSNTSRRSRLSSQSPQSQSKKKEKEQQMAYFNEILTDAGVTLKYNDKPNIISQEQALVTRDTNKALRAHITYPNNAQEFMTGLKILCRKDSCFRKALLPTELKKVDDTGFTTDQSKVQQDSLIRMLLNVSCLQNEIVEMLLEHITNCASEESEDTTWLRLLLNPLRYLSHINDSRNLTVKLLDILEVATYTAQLEILNTIPEIIPDNEFEETAKQLSKTLEENSDLTAAIIDCLNSLNLSSEIRNDIQQQILIRLESSSCSKIFPILFEFLITDCNAKNLPNVLSHARNAIDTIMASESNDKETVSSKVLIFNRLQAFATARRTLCEGWITLISNVRASADHKPIDLLILFMLHSLGNSRKSVIEGLIRKKIKSGLFKVSLLENLFKNYFVTQILKDYLNSIIEIATSLLRSYNEPVLIDFSSSMYKMLFSDELIDRIQRQDIVYNLILLTGMSDKKGVTPVLYVLTSLLEYFETLQQHSVQLMGLLEKLDAIELKDAKLIFDLLCSLTCGEKADESMSGLRDELHMIVRKQLSSAKRIVKHRGIIAAVAMAKSLAITAEEPSLDAIDENSMSISDLPGGNPQDAATILNLANTCTLGSPDSVGLYYDQLASMVITATNLENQFMTWLYKLITNEFQNIFITENVSSPINDIEMSMQYSLNTAEEMDTPIAVNIAELTLRSQYYENNSILTLAPIFRLLRLIHFRQHNEDLQTIDALLGCAIIMPNLNDIDVYDSEQLKQVADCIFHCINWFREIISAFVTQRNRKLRHKVLERLTDVVSLEELLEKCLENIPEHKLPTSYFDILSQTSKQLSPSKASGKSTRPPRKKQKTSDTIVNPDDTVASTSAAVTQSKSSGKSTRPPRKKQKTTDTIVNPDDTVASTFAVVTQTTKTTTASTKKRPKELIKETENVFREMDTDIILLLRYPLRINDDLSSTISQNSMASQTIVLEISQFQFLMKDFVYKLETLSKNKKLGFSHMSVINLSDLIKDSIRLLPYIKKQFNVILSNIDRVLGQAEGILDSEQLFTPEANNLKATFALIIKSYNLIFGWSGFQHTKNLNLLRDCLKALRDETQSQMMSVKGLSMEFATKIISYINYCLYLPSAVNLVQIIQALYSVTSNPELKKKITIASEKLLNKKWYNTNGDLEMGKNSSLHTDILVKAYLNGASVKTICGLVGTLQRQVSALKEKNDCLEMLAGINKSNFYILYRCLCITLLEGIKTEITALTNNQHLVLWRTTALTMQGLMTVVKAQEGRTNLVSFLKSSIGILKVFLSSGVPILELMLRSKTDDVIEIFKIIQTSTRFLHHLCCYSKYTKDTSLIAFVPQFRLLLESLLYRVKAALVANGCSAAFWMGTLRNKDLQGEDILSQSSKTTDDSEQTSDNEELPPDESDNDDEEGEPAAEEGGGAASDGDSSASEIF